MATEEMKVKVSADVAGAVNGLKQVNNELAKTGPVATKTGKDFTNLGRVIQDLPFGFIGIQNNLTQLIPAVGGVGIAFSVLVAAITFAQTGLSNWTRGLIGSKAGIDENSASLIRLSNDIDDAKSRMDQFVTTLEQVNKLGKLRLDIDFGKGLGTDLLNLQGISTGNRELISQLNDTEQIIRDGASKIRGEFLDKLAGTKYFDDFDQGILDASKLPEDLKGLFDRMNDAEKDHSKIQSDILKARAGQNIIYAQIAQQKIDILEEAAKKEEEARKKSLAALKKQLEEEEKLRIAHLEAMHRTFVDREKPIPMLIQLELAKVQAKNDPSETFGQKLTKELLPETIPLRVNVAPKVVVAAPVELTELQKALEVAVTDIGLETATTLGNAIAAGITGSNIGSAFESLFSFIGGAIQEFGKKIIALSSLMLALQKAIGKLNPAASLAAGIGLVVLGSIMKNLKPKGFAAGGLAFGPTLGLVGEGIGTSRSNPEVIAPLDKLKNFIGNSGGTQVFIPSLELSYNKLMIAFNRAGRYGGLTS